jgi:hypothetical protein
MRESRAANMDYRIKVSQCNQKIEDSYRGTDDLFQASNIFYRTHRL